MRLVPSNIEHSSYLSNKTDDKRPVIYHMTVLYRYTSRTVYDENDVHYTSYTINSKYNINTFHYKN